MSRKRSIVDEGDISGTSYYSLLNEFHVSSEEELLKRLARDAETLPCACGCGKEYSISKIRFFGGDPYYVGHMGK